MQGRFEEKQAQRKINEALCGLRYGGKKLRKVKKHDGKKTRERGGEYAAGLGEGRTGV